MELKIDQLISESQLAKALGVSKQSLAQWRRRGCSWIEIAGHPFYHEPTLMDWILKNCEKSKDRREKLSTD